MKKAWFILYRWYSAMEENGINSTLSSNPDLSTLLKNGTSRHDDRPFVVWISSLIVVTAILIIIFNTLVVFTFSRQYHHMDNKTVFYVFIAISDFFAGVYLLTNTLWYVKTPMHFSFGMCMFLHTFGIILFYVSAYPHPGVDNFPIYWNPISIPREMDVFQIILRKNMLWIVDFDIVCFYHTCLTVIKRKVYLWMFHS